MSQDEQDLVLGRLTRETDALRRRAAAIDAELSRHGRNWYVFGAACGEAGQGLPHAYSTLRATLDSLDKDAIVALLEERRVVAAQLGTLTAQLKELRGQG